MAIDNKLNILSEDKLRELYGIPKLENEDREKPMLIFHFLNARLGKFKNPDDDNLKKYDNNKYIGLGIILPGSKEKNDAIKYKVNQVYWEQHIKPKWEDENEVSNKNEE